MRTSIELWKKYQEYCARKDKESTSNCCGFLTETWCSECMKTIPYDYETWYKNWGFRCKV